MRNVEEYQRQYIGIEGVNGALTKKWKSQGIDKIPNFSLDTFSATHAIMETLFNEMMLEPTPASEWSSQNVTYFSPKNNDTENPKNY